MKCDECDIEMFISSNKKTYLCKKCGKMVEAKEKGEEKNFPPIVDQASNFVGSMVNFAKSGFKTTDEEEKERRLNICYDCDRFDKASIRCLECGCKLKAKANIDSEKCPLGKWKN